MCINISRLLNILRELQLLQIFVKRVIMTKNVIYTLLCPINILCSYKNLWNMLKPIKEPFCLELQYFNISGIHHNNENNTNKVNSYLTNKRKGIKEK